MCIGGVSVGVIIIIQNTNGPGRTRHVHFILLLKAARDVDILLVIGHASGSPEQENRSRSVGLVHNRGRLGIMHNRSWPVWQGIAHCRGWLGIVCCRGRLITVVQVPRIYNTRCTSTRHMDVSLLLVAARHMHLTVNRSMMNRPVEGLMNRSWSVRILHRGLGHMGVVRAAGVNNTSGTS